MTVLQLFNYILVYFLTIPDYISPWATATATTAPNTTQPCFYLGVVLFLASFQPHVGC